MENKTLNVFKFFDKSVNISDLILVACNIDTPENVGGLIRIASNAGCKNLIVTKSRNFKMSKIKRNATNAFDKMSWQFVDADKWHEYIPQDYEIVGIETATNSSNIYKNKFKDKTAIVVGNESYGLSEEDLKHCDKVLFIPSPGEVKSLNVVQSAAVSLFEYLRQKFNS